MENALHRFVRLLRLRQVRISIPEALDAMACAREPGMLRDKAHLKAALRVALIKDRRDEEVFDEIFDKFFALVKVGPHRDRARPRARPRRPLRRRRARGLHALRGAERDPAAGPQPRQAGRHPRLLQPRGPRPAVQPAPGGQQDRPGGDDRRDRALQGQPGPSRARATGCRSRPTGSPRGHPRARSASSRARRSTPTCRSPQQEALLGWLNDVEDEVAGTRHRGRRRRAAPPAHRRPRRAARGDQEAPGGAARAGAAGRRVEHERAVAEVDRVGEHERMELEESLRRLAHSLHGGLTHKRRVSASGRIDSGRTMRRNMRFDGIPFVAGHGAARRGQAAAGDARRRLAVRAGDGAVHPAPRARPAEPVRPGAHVRVRRRAGGDHRPVRGPPRRARARAGVRRGRARRRRELRLRRGVRARSTRTSRSAVNRRTTVLVLGDGRGNGNDPNLPGVRGDHPAGPGDDLADARTALLVGAGRLRPARCTPSTAAGCGWCAT